MDYIEAPTEIPSPVPSQPFIFLAGGITNCPDWQKQVRNSLEDIDHGTLINPRREEFPSMDAEEEGHRQIGWEFNMLWNWTDIFTMWFCNETLGPICLYELGAYLARCEVQNRSQGLQVLSPLSHVVIGCESGYARTFDVMAQARLILGQDFFFSTSVEEHAQRIRDAVLGYREPQ